MTVRELIDQLARMDPDAIVVLDMWDDDGRQFPLVDVEAGICLDDVMPEDRGRGVGEEENRGWEGPWAWPSDESLSLPHVRLVPGLEPVGAMPSREAHP